jgi:low affinity Fe/Cu permease
MEWHEVIRTAAAVLTFLMAAIIVPLARLVGRIRANDLKHMDHKLDNLANSVDRVHAKLDKHLVWHLNNKQP